MRSVSNLIGDVVSETTRAVPVVRVATRGRPEGRGTARGRALRPSRVAIARASRASPPAPPPAPSSSDVLVRRRAKNDRRTPHALFSRGYRRLSEGNVMPSMARIPQNAMTKMSTPTTVATERFANLRASAAGSAAGSSAWSRRLADAAAPRPRVARFLRLLSQRHGRELSPARLPRASDRQPRGRARESPRGVLGARVRIPEGGDDVHRPAHLRVRERRRDVPDRRLRPPRRGVDETRELARGKHPRRRRRRAGASRRRPTRTRRRIPRANRTPPRSPSPRPPPPPPRSSPRGRSRRTRSLREAHGTRRSRHTPRR